MSQSETNFDQALLECENSRRIIRSTASLLKEATYPGAKHKQVSESLGYLEFLEKMMDQQMENLRKDKKAAKKSAGAVSVLDETPKADAPEAPTEVGAA